jgi:hypothetical protein
VFENLVFVISARGGVSVRALELYIFIPRRMWKFDTVAVDKRKEYSKFGNTIRKWNQGIKQLI